MYEIEITGCPESVWLVPDDQAEAARARARNPGRLWGFSEVRQLKASGATTQEAVAIAEAKQLMQGGALLWLRPGKAEREAREKDAEQVALFE